MRYDRNFEHSDSSESDHRSRNKLLQQTSGMPGVRTRHHSDSSEDNIATRTIPFGSRTVSNDKAFFHSDSSEDAKRSQFVDDFKYEMKSDFASHRKAFHHSDSSEDYDSKKFSKNKPNFPNFRSYLASDSDSISREGKLAQLNPQHIRTLASINFLMLTLVM
jgi:hypothetical protein